MRPVYDKFRTKTTSDVSLVAIRTSDENKILHPAICILPSPNLATWLRPCTWAGFVFGFSSFVIFLHNDWRLKSRTRLVFARSSASLVERRAWLKVVACFNHQFTFYPIRKWRRRELNCNRIVLPNEVIPFKCLLLLCFN